VRLGRLPLVNVSHIILRVADMNRSLAFYRDLVGFPVRSASDAFSFLDGGSIQIALNSTTDAVRDETSTEIVLEVDDLDAAYAAMARRGVQFLVEPREVMRSESGTLRAAHFRDPDGHVTSITGWAPPGR
jgi:catechol 2,3-dioxygenase-like lactoylglutathione lyase family enzyme